MSMMQMLLGAGGAAGLKVEDVFSTDLYSGDGSTQSITNGIDLAGEGGLVWVKARSNTFDNALFDTERGATYRLTSNAEGNSSAESTALTAFNSNGWTTGGSAYTNYSSTTYASWTFRKAEKFFDIVTWTGDGTDDRAINHNLGCVPGMILVKKTDGDGQYWAAYHVAAGATHYMKLNDNMAAYDHSTFWWDTAPTSTQFTVGGTTSVNHNGGSHIAYLFATDEDFIKCGSYTGNNSTDGPTVNVGFEPQWLLVKGIDYAGGWAIQDTERGINVSSPPRLEANSNMADFSTADNNIQLSSTGFQIKGTGGTYNDNGITYGYVAIKKPD